MNGTSRLYRARLSCFALVALTFVCRAAAAQPAADQASLEGLRFIEGSWKGVFRGDSPYETYWSGPEGGAYMGMIRFFQGDSTRIFELLTIERRPRGLVLSVKHFNPGLVGWEEKADAVRYRLIELTGERAVFEHEGDGTRLAMERGAPDRHFVRRGALEGGQWVWTDLFVGTRAR
jgi:hypothetical protein